MIKKTLALFFLVVSIGFGSFHFKEETRSSKISRGPAGSPDQSFTFVFNSKDFKSATGVVNEEKDFVIVVSAPDRLTAMERASKLCFKKLSGGVYPGEDKGLEIIDICANPR